MRQKKNERGNPKVVSPFMPELVIIPEEEWNATGTLTVSGNGAMKQYSGTDMPWYAYASRIKKVFVGEGVTSIGKNAFNNEKAGFVFSEISLPSTLTSIGNYAFYNCSSLTDITIPASVDTIGRFAFRRSGLESVTFGGNNAWSIGDEGVFSFADALNALVNRYYDKAWTSAEAADAVSVVAVGKCGKDVDWLLSDDGVLTVTGSGAMYDFGAKTAPWVSYKAQIKSVVIGEGVTSIGNCAFYQCVNIESVTFASSVTKIGDYVFYGCSSLGKVTIPASVEYIGKYTFRKSCITSVSFENAISWRINGLGDALKLADEATSAALLKANYKDAWIRIGNGDETLIAFGDCGDDVDWTLSGDGTLTVFGDGEMYDFSGNTVPWASYKAQIKKVVVCEGVTNIGNSAFYECANITSISLPSTLTGIGNYAFYGCKALTEMTVPASVNTIGAYAFRKCNSLTTATFENADSWSYGDASAEISAEALKSNYKNAWTRA